jgi:fumarate reductase subunit D
MLSPQELTGGVVFTFVAPTKVFFLHLFIPVIIFDEVNVNISVISIAEKRERRK